MKKLSMILLTLLLAFGFSSAAMANGDRDYDDNDRHHYDKDRGITTVVKTKTEVSYDKKVDVKKFREYFTEKKSSVDTRYEDRVKEEKQKHPRKDWYRKVMYIKTYQIDTHKTWDEVTRVDKKVYFTTPVKIIKTKVTTIKYKGKNIKKGKIISKDVQKYVDKKYGKTKKHVEKNEEVFKKNEHTKVFEKVIKERKEVGKWHRGKRH